MFTRSRLKRCRASDLRVFGAIVALAWLTAQPAAAHPLGNFTINHLTKLSFAGERVSLRYVLDMAEIPTYQTLRQESADGNLGGAQLASWARREAAVALLPALTLFADGRPVVLTLDRASARKRPGAGGLPTLYVTLDAHAALASAAGTRAFSYHDGTFAGRLGWRDVVVAPATEPTRELTAYPSALLGSPRALDAVEIAVGANGSRRVSEVPSVEANAAAAPASAIRANQLSDMLARGTGNSTFVLFTFLVAIALGALHALEPGHGKTLLAISLVGARATVKQASILAGALTVAHTAGVLALGLALNLFKGYFVPEAIYPWITLLSGVAIAVIGARAVQRQIRLRQPLAHVHAHGHAHAHPHEHPHVHQAHTHDGAGDAAHGHAHTHDHDDGDHARQHAIPGSAPLTFGATVLAAMSGGIAPCPAALVVLLAALALNQVAYGILVIVAFSLGLAATLTGLGIAVVRGASWLQRRPQFERFVHFGPLASAVVISGIGALMVGQGFAQQGMAASPLAVAALTALAIAGYAFSHPFSPRRIEATS